MRRFTGTLLLTAVLLPCLFHPPVLHAQATGARMRVLVPPFAAEGRDAVRTGQRIADRVRRQIDALPRHVSVEPREVAAALRQYGLRETELGCTEWRQLAPRVDAALVLCGTIGADGTVDAAFISPTDDARFDVPSFAPADDAAAAVTIVTAFGEFVEQISLAYYCAEAVGMEAWEEAVSRCRAAVARNATLVSARYSLAGALIRLDRHEEALAAYEAVLEQSPLHSDARLGAGIAAARLGRQALSIQYLEEYLELNPGDDEIRLNIAFRLAEAGDPAGALRMVDAAVAHPAATRSMLEYAGHFAMNAALLLIERRPAGDDDQAAVHALLRTALTHYQRALALAGDEPDATVLRNVMVAHARLGDTEAAMAAGARATAASADAQTWSAYADVLREGGSHEAALAALDRVRTIDPDYARVDARRALVLIQLGRVADALAAAESSIARDEIDAAMRELIAQSFAVAGMRRTQADRFDEALPYMAAARRIGRAELTIGMINYIHGYTLMRQAETVAAPENAAAARRALPLFEQAYTMLESAGAYREADANRRAYMARTQRFIEIQRALIRIGR